MRHFCLSLFLCCLVAGGVAPKNGFGQDDRVLQEWSDSVHDGIEAVQGGEKERGMELLEDGVLDSLSYIDEEYGAAAYWLGQAYVEDGHPRKALPTWRSALLSLNAEDKFRARLADAFIHQVFNQEAENYYGSALDAYRQMLTKTGTGTLTPEGKKRVAQRLRHLGLVLPNNVRRRAGLPPVDSEIHSGTLSGIDGEILVQWWRSQDPLPATPENEQMKEHLQRVVHSSNRYAHPETTYGFDERGQVYVRFGPPDHNVTINYNQSKLTDLITEREVGVDVTLSDFPENEFWSYGNYDRDVYYLFVEKEKGGPLQIGRTEDLIPRSLRGPFNTSNKRGIQRSLYSLATLRAIYRKYSPFHPDLAARHDDVANYLSLAETGGLEQFDTVNFRSPDVFASRTFLKHKNEDAVAAKRREERTPNQLSSAKRETPPLDVALRTARFLNDDGTTRTEIYWAPKEGAMQPSEEQYEALREQGYADFDKYLLRLTVSQETADYRTRIFNREHYRLQGLADTEAATILPRTFRTSKGDSALYHVAMQWDQYLLPRSEDSIGPKVRMASVRQDSLQSLVRDERVLEMSDLKPLVIPEDGEGLDSSIPYPFRTVTPNTSLTLYFELYHLPLDGTDRTEYTVEYEMYRRADRGSLVELVRGDDEKRTSVSTTNRGASRNTKEYIRLDFANWALDTESNLIITVRVTDETTGQQVERSLDFEISPSAS